MFLSKADLTTSLSEKKLRFVLVAVGLATVLFVGWRFFQDWHIIKGTLQRARYGLLALSFLPVQASLALFTGGWHLLMSRLANADNFWQNCRFYCLSNFAKNLPTPVWYIGGRAHLYGQAGYPRSAAIAASFMELILHSLTGLQILAWLELLSASRGPLSFLYLAASMPLLWLVLKPEAMSSILKWWWRRRGSSVQAPEFSRRDVLQLMLTYSLTWVNSIPFLCLITRAWLVSEPPSWVSLWEMWLVSSLIGYMATTLLGGAGFMREASLAMLLSSVAPFSIAVVVAASSRLILMVGEIAWGTAVVGASRWMLVGRNRSG